MSTDMQEISFSGISGLPSIQLLQIEYLYCVVHADRIDSGT